MRAMAAYPPGMSDASELHERDFYAWTQSQAALLRAWPEALRPNALDVANLAEEIEDLGKSQRTAAQSLIEQIVLHLLKLRCHPDQTARRHWQREILAFRNGVDRIFEDNPSLRASRIAVAERVWPRAARLFRSELEIDGFDARAALAWLASPAEPYFDLDHEVLAEGWYPPPPST